MGRQAQPETQQSLLCLILYPAVKHVQNLELDRSAMLTAAQPSRGVQCLLVSIKLLSTISGTIISCPGTPRAMRIIATMERDAAHGWTSSLVCPGSLQFECFLGVFVYDIRLVNRQSRSSRSHSGRRHRTGSRESRLTIDTAGTTLSKFGVKPLNNPFTPSYFNVCLVTSRMPV